MNFFRTSATEWVNLEHVTQVNVGPTYYIFQFIDGSECSVPVSELDPVIRNIFNQGKPAIAVGSVVEVSGYEPLCFAQVTEVPEVPTGMVQIRSEKHGEVYAPITQLKVIGYKP